MSKFIYNKLIRSKIVDTSTTENHEISYKEIDLSDLDYKKALKNKLLEEATEVIDAQSEKETLEELADLLEVIKALTLTLGFSMDQLEKARASKVDSRGDFSRKTKVIYAEIKQDNHNSEAKRLVKYFRTNPDKYLEID